MTSRCRVRVSRSSPQLEAGIFIPNGPDASRLRLALTYVDAKAFQARNSGIETEVTNVYGFREVTGGIQVPRHFPIELFDDDTIWDMRRKYEAGALGSHTMVVWRSDTQIKASAALLASTEDKVLCLSCGQGKSVIALASASKGLRAPTIVVVHTQALLEQWVKEAITHLGLREDQIGRIHGASRGMKARCDWQGKVFVVAMLHTLVKKEALLGEGFRGYWRLVITDELHRYGAQWFSKVIWQFPCERWGLTATINRDDGFDELFRHHFGAICFEDLSQDLKPTVYFASTPFNEKDTKRIPKWHGRRNMPILTTKLSRLKERNKMIVSSIQRAMGKGRRILVLGERVDQLFVLWEQLECDSKGVFVGTMKKADQQESLKKDVIFATPGMAKEGVNKPDWDTLFILSPFKGPGRFTQTGGRILRTHAGKQKPAIIVLVDDFEECKNVAYRMQRNADSLDWAYKEILFDKLV